MDVKLIISGRVEKGKLANLDRAAFQRDLGKFEGRDVEITISVQPTIRTNKANRYYHGVVIPNVRQGVFETQGTMPSAKEVHEWLKNQFCNKELYNEHTKEYFSFPQKTSELTVAEFYEYVERCKAFALDFLNVYIPSAEVTNLYSGI